MQTKKTALDKQLFYNETNGLIVDLAETFEQRLNEQSPMLAGRMELFWKELNGDDVVSRRISLADPGYKQLALDFAQFATSNTLQRTLQMFGKPPTLATYKEQRAIIDRYLSKKPAEPILMVAHSQGNLFAVNAFDYIKTKYGQDKAFLIQVAPASTQLRGLPVLADKDLVISSLRNSGPNSSGVTDDIPPYDTRPPGLNGLTDYLGHGFLEIYLNPALATSKRISDYVSTGMSKLTANTCLLDGTSLSEPVVLDHEPPGFSMNCDTRNCIVSSPKVIEELKRYPLIFAAINQVSNVCHSGVFDTVSGTWIKSRSVYAVNCVASNVAGGSVEVPVQVVRKRNSR